MAAPIGSPAPAPASEDWASQAADTVVNVVDAVREKTTARVLTVVRAVVYGIIGLFAVIVALVVLTIMLVRVVDIILPGDVWSAHLLIGVIFTIGGLLVWRKRYAPDTAG